VNLPRFPTLSEHQNQGLIRPLGSKVHVTNLMNGSPRTGPTESEPRSTSSLTANSKERIRHLHSVAINALCELEEELVHLLPSVSKDPRVPDYTLSLRIIGGRLCLILCVEYRLGISFDEPFCEAPPDAGIIRLLEQAGLSISSHGELRYAPFNCARCGIVTPGDVSVGARKEAARCLRCGSLLDEEVLGGQSICGHKRFYVSCHADMAAVVDRAFDHLMRLTVYDDSNYPWSNSR
jgi:hypothetical protein